MRNALVLTAIGLALLFPPSASAQLQRFELSQRLRAFEIALEKHPDREARHRALDPLQRAMPLFFLGRFEEAGRLLDRAQCALASPFEPPPDVLWARSVSLLPRTVLLDASAATLPFTLAPFYLPKGETPAAVTAQVTLQSPIGKQIVSSTSLSLRRLPVEGKLPLARGGSKRETPLPPGDYSLHLHISQKGPLTGSLPLTVSLAADLDTRLSNLRVGLAALPAKPVTTDKETIRSLLQLLTRLRAGERLETNYPASRLLEEAEAALAAIQAGKTSFGHRRPGQFWLTLALKDGTKPVRLLAPKAAARGEPLPLLIALHGAGGSENLWFDGYGNGLAARLCEKRGWLLVAPRDGTAAGLIDALNDLYPVDRGKVYLVGHSMGAAQAVAEACRRPKDYAGVAALGGGGPVTASAALKRVPYFVGVGSEDFLLRAARDLAGNLKAAGVRSRLQEYPDVEHLTVAQVALPEALEWLTDAATNP